MPLRAIGSDFGKAAIDHPDDDALTVPHVSPLTVYGSGHVSATTDAAGTGFVAFPSQDCSRVILVNDSDTTIEVKQYSQAPALPIPAGTIFTFNGVLNTAGLSIRRKDQALTPVTIVVRWEVDYADYVAPSGGGGAA